jgi:flavin-dependent dehydrogenase
VKTDVVIVGGGPAGAASAMSLTRLGIRSVIVERSAFPRYHVGESMTGECAGILGLDDRMRRAGHPMKQGVKVFGGSRRHSWWVPVMARDAAGGFREQSTWQVRRSDFDSMMLDEAIARGATLVNGKAVKPLSDGGAVRGVRVRTAREKPLDIAAQVLLDCSGQATFLANAGVTGGKYLGNYDRQIALFSQMTGAIRDDGSSRNAHRDNTLIFYQKKFHWAWFIPLDADVVSVGVVTPAAYFLEAGESKSDFLVRELRTIHPELARRIPEVRLDRHLRRPGVRGPAVDDPPPRSAGCSGARRSATRVYEDEGMHSVPIASRFHPERAALWTVGDSLTTTEPWMCQDLAKDPGDEPPGGGAGS